MKRIDRNISLAHRECLDCRVIRENIVHFSRVRKSNKPSSRQPFLLRRGLMFRREKITMLCFHCSPAPCTVSEVDLGQGRWKWIWPSCQEDSETALASAIYFSHYGKNTSSNCSFTGLTWTGKVQQCFSRSISKKEKKNARQSVAMNSHLRKQPTFEK